jgi:hypothetical protein
METEKFIMNSFTLGDINDEQLQLSDQISKDDEQKEFIINFLDSDEENSLQTSNIFKLQRTTTNQPLIARSDLKIPHTDTMPIIWLDIDVHETSENVQFQNILKSITKLLKVFNMVELCEEYIRQMDVDESLIFIVSGLMSTLIIPFVHVLPHVKIIYIYSTEIDYYQRKFKQYNKVNKTENDTLVKVFV